MCVDHRRLHVAVPEQLLHRANVIARFQQMRGEAMPQRVRPNRFRDSNASSRFANGSLGHGLVQVMPAPLSRARVSRDGRGGKDPLPTLFAVRVWVFARQGIGKGDPSEPCRQVGRVELANPFEMSAQPRDDRRWQRRHPILVALASAHKHPAAAEVNVLYAQAKAFH